MVNQINELNSSGEKISYVKENMTEDNIKDVSFILKTPDFQRYIQMITNKGRKNLTDFTESEYIPISQLVYILQTVYNYSGEETGVSDEDYDVLYEILENKDLEIITTPILKKEVVHHQYVHLRGTLEKIYALDDEENLSNLSRKRLSDWVKSSESAILQSSGRKVSLWEEEIYLFPKWDGVSIIFEIDSENKIKKALTRGNTALNEAEDVTFIFKLVERKVVCPEMKGNPYGLKTEVMMNEKDLDDYNKRYNTSYKSTRSIVSSIINSDKADGREQLLEIVKLRTSVIIDGEERIEELSSEAFERPFIRCQLKDIYGIKKFSNHHKYVDGLRCDGSVIYLINEELRNILGRKNEKNKFEVAYKFNEEVSYTKIKDVIFQMGTFGTINPVAIFEPVKMKGNEIQRVSLGSMYRFYDLGLSKGDVVKISYEIIPYLNFDLDDPKCKKSKNKPFKRPEVCPECGHPLEYVDNQIPKCENPDCDFLKKRKIVNYIQKMNMSGISYETISLLYDNNLVKSIKDLYRINGRKKAFKDVHGFGEGKLSILINEIDSHRKVIDSIFLASIGIPHASKEMFKKVLQVFTIDEVLDFADSDNYIPLTEIKGIKDAKAKNMITGLRKNRSLIIFLLDELDIISGRDTHAYQVRFKACFTKIRSDIITKLIESKKGVVSDNMTKDVDFLIVPSKNTESSSVTKALKYGIPIIPIDDVENYILAKYR